MDFGLIDDFVGAQNWILRKSVTWRLNGGFRFVMGVPLVIPFLDGVFHETIHFWVQHPHSRKPTSLRNGHCEFKSCHCTYQHEINAQAAQVSSHSLVVQMCLPVPFPSLSWMME